MAIRNKASRKGTQSVATSLKRQCATLLRTVLGAALGLIIAGHALPLHAAKLYQVELVVFANATRSFERKEIWPSDIELTLPRPLQLLRVADGIAAGASADMNVFENLPREHLALRNEAAALSRSGHRVLLHTAWLQSIGNIDNARNVYLEGGNRIEPFHELAGTLRFYRQQFVHVDTNLWLAKFTTPNSQPALYQQQGTGITAANGTARNGETATASWPLPPLPPQQSDSWGDENDASAAGSGDGDINALLAKEIAVERIVLMQQHRRLKQKELNYLDHPLFGALIVVTPYAAANETATAPIP